MKKTNIILVAMLAALVACKPQATQDQAEHPHDGHDHEDHAHEHAEHGHGHEHGPDGHSHSDHEKKPAGPNGGRVIASVEPHAEFLIKADRTLQITFLDDAFKPTAVGEQIVSLSGGDRAAPFKIGFAKQGDSLVSDKPLPAGDNHPIVLQIKANADAKATIEKFHANLGECPSCDYAEYACICGHDADHGHEKETMK